MPALALRCVPEHVTGLNPGEHRAQHLFPAGVRATQDARMMRPPPFIPLLLLALAMVLPVSAQAQAADPVTIYRCTDAKGRLTLRDSPCNKGERQEARSMLRPKDAPPRPPLPAPAPTGVAVAPPPQIIIVNTPRPLYECIAPDNSRYLSDTPEGNAHWVPLWPNGYPVPGQVVYEPGRLNVRVDNGRVSGGYDSGATRVLTPTYSEFGGGTWVRDPCHALPQVDVCERLVDRRDALRRRYSIAQPSERAVLGQEERSINARLAQDCR